ncbi:hypothetical protein QJS66_13965 [Kocuria rhizophila]|nr:hypothetical protein QJS66_13965 [Kocuria rhizophila]
MLRGGAPCRPWWTARARRRGVPRLPGVRIVGGRHGGVGAGDVGPGDEPRSCPLDGGGALELHGGHLASVRAELLSVVAVQSARPWSGGELQAAAGDRADRGVGPGARCAAVRAEPRPARPLASAAAAVGGLRAAGGLARAGGPAGTRGHRGQSLAALTSVNDLLDVSRVGGRAVPRRPATGPGDFGRLPWPLRQGRLGLRSAPRPGQAKASPPDPVCSSASSTARRCASGPPERSGLVTAGRAAAMRVIAAAVAAERHDEMRAVPAPRIATPAGLGCGRACCPTTRGPSGTLAGGGEPGRRG